MKLTKLLELHLVHDPDKGELEVEVIAAAGGERIRYTAKGRYSNIADEPTASLDFNQPTYDASFSTFKYIVPMGRPLVDVTLKAHMEAEDVKRERLPAGTSAVAPPSGDEINK